MKRVSVLRVILLQPGLHSTRDAELHERHNYPVMYVTFYDLETMYTQISMTNRPTS